MVPLHMVVGSALWGAAGLSLHEHLIAQNFLTVLAIGSGTLVFSSLVLSRIIIRIFFQS